MRQSPCEGHVEIKEKGPDPWDSKRNMMQDVKTVGGDKQTAHKQHTQKYNKT